MGIRAAESSNRARATAWKRNESNSTKTREWFDWLPIFKWSTEEVFEAIARAGQKPHHAYSLGNQRLSCVFCFMGSKSDLQNGARHNPELYARYLALEARVGYTLHMSRRSLLELTVESDVFKPPIPDPLEPDFDFENLL